MQKKDFDELIALRAELTQLESMLDTLRSRLSFRCVADSVRGSSTTFPYFARTFHIEGEVDLETNRQINREIAKHRRIIMDKRLRIARQITLCERQLAEVSDSVTRQVLRLRYMEGLSWQAVASRMGYANECSPRRICEKYFKTET